MSLEVKYSRIRSEYQTICLRLGSEEFEYSFLWILLQSPMILSFIRSPVREEEGEGEGEEN